ncbi:MAG: EI24 domain-containing protein [Roseiflexaceae bacterium]|nr:EI24 domain-containing protein [Roseiflexaceae bacterium]
MVNLFNGATYPFRALGYLARNPQLWGFVIVPILVNIIVAAVLYVGLLAGGFAAIDNVVVDTGWGDVLEGLLRLVLVVGLLIVAGFLLVRFGVVLGSPWYGKLSERIEADKLGSAPPAEPLTPRGIARDLGRALSFELKKLALFLLIGGLLLLVNVIPVAGQIIAAVGWVLLGDWIACLDFFDGPQERRRLRFREKLANVRRALPGSAGFGLVAFGLVSIPFVNLLAIPLCVAAGTLFFCDHVRANQMVSAAETKRLPV